LKIIDNPSTKELLNQIRAMESLENLYRVVPWANCLCPKLSEIFSDFSEIKRQVEVLLLPDQFNETFSSLGWIAYESLNLNAMKQAIEISETAGVEDAEKFLANHYNEETLKWGILRFSGHPDCRKRLRLIELAKDDYLAERYHACIPLLISLTDGLVNDVSKHVGLFAENTDMIAWDSIAAHETGLQSLAKLLGRGRNKTNEEEITIPFRHGILHGRELAFDNKIVAAKCWSTLFAVRDWAGSIANGKKYPKPKEQVRWSELLKQLTENARTKQLLEQWQPRTLEQLGHLPSSNSSMHLPEDSPERVVAEFTENWIKKRYGKMAEALLDFVNTPLGKKAGQVKQDFGHINLSSYEIKAVEDEAASASRVQVYLEFSKQGEPQLEELWIRVVYQNHENTPLIRGEEGGKWKILQNGFSKVIYPISV
jgi:hypothetical protein